MGRAFALCLVIFSSSVFGFECSRGFRSSGEMLYGPVTRFYDRYDRYLRSGPIWTAERIHYCLTQSPLSHFPDPIKQLEVSSRKQGLRYIAWASFDFPLVATYQEIAYNREGWPYYSKQYAKQKDEICQIVEEAWDEKSAREQVLRSARSALDFFSRKRCK